MAQLQALGSFNSFIPAATGQLISFQRDPKEFRLNRYVQMVQTKKPLGIYKRASLDYSVRTLGRNASVWANGQKRPQNPGNQLRFEDVMFQTIRRTEVTQIGWQTIEHADVKILVASTEGIQSQMMVKRVNRVMELAETSSNWGANSTAAVNVMNRGAGYWDQGQSDETSPFFCAIKKTLNAVAVRINLLTNGRINSTKNGVLKLIISPEAAWRISETPEIHAYLKQSPEALAQVRGDKAGQNADYGLPDKLYGWDIEVEDCVQVTSNEVAADSFGNESSIATGDRRYAKATNSAIVASRVGGLDGQYGSESFSTLQIFYLDQELQVETKDDDWNRLTDVAVTEDNVEVLAAPPSGFLLTDLFSPASL